MTDFAPAQVTKKLHEASADGEEGAAQAAALAGTHTWDAYNAAKGKPSSAEAHKIAMAAATARIRSPPSPNGSNSQALVPVGDGTSGSASGAGESPLAVLLAAAGGDAKAALDGAMRRERALRREIDALHKAAAAARSAASTSEHQLRHEAEAAQRVLKAKTASLDALGRHIGGPLSSSSETLAACYSGLQRSINELGTALALAEVRRAAHEAGEVPLDDADVSPAELSAGLDAAVARYPALRGLVEAGRATDAAVAEVTSHVSSAAALAGGAAAKPRPSAAAGASASAAAAPGFLGYSSLSAAVAAPVPMGDLGASSRLIPGGGGGNKGNGKADRRARSRSPSLATASVVTAEEEDQVDGDVRRSGGGRPHHLTGSAKAWSGVKKITSAQIMQRARAMHREMTTMVTMNGATGGVGDSKAATAPPATSSSSSAAPLVVTGGAASALAAIQRLGGGVNSSRGGRASAAATAAASQPASSPIASSASSSASSSSTATAATASPAPSKPSAKSASGASSSELSVADTLRRLYAFYTAPDVTGSSSSSSASDVSNALMSVGLLYAMLRDGGMDISTGDAAALVARVVTSSSSSAGALFSYESFVSCLNAAAQASYRAPGSVGAASGLSEADAFRLLLQRHVLPLYARLEAAGAIASGPTGAHAARLRLLHGVLTSDLATWLSSHGAGLAGVFASYADGSAPTGSGGGGSTTRTMSHKGLTSWAADFKVAPGLLPASARADLLPQLADAV